MKRKIATLDVYWDLESPEVSGSGQVGPKQYHVTINGGKRNPVKTVSDFQTILAHELGHFVALITKDATHDPTNKLGYALTGDSSFLLPAEHKAWGFAHEMFPDLDTKLERNCLASYEENAWKSEIPRTFEPIPSGLPMPTESAQEKRQRLLDIYWQAENAKLAHRAHVWEWSVLGTIFALYWLAGLLTLGGVR